MLLWVMMLLPSGAMGEDTQAVHAFFSAAHPGYAVSEMDRCGESAAAVMSRDQEHILCVARQGEDGVWRMLVDNPSALRQGTQSAPRLLMDTDNALFWTYRGENETDTFSSIRNGDVWGGVGLIHADYEADGSAQEVMLYFEDDGFEQVYYECDENDNVIFTTKMMRFPAPQLAERALLENFESELLWIDPLTGWPDGTILRVAAENWMPGYTYVDGIAQRDEVRLLMRRPDGEQVFVGVSEDENGEAMRFESTPLPEGAWLGVENFTGSIGLSSDLMVSVSRWESGVWGISLIDSSDGDTMDIGENWIAAEHNQRADARLFCDHPWSDVSGIDWSGIPSTKQAAYAMVNAEGYATPANPNPEDRLNLRTAPRKGAASLGKYYNGTPVKVLERQGVWTKVSVLGRGIYDDRIPRLWAGHDGCDAGAFDDLAQGAGIAI